MMKKHNIALTILVALGVTACGSSGGGSSSSPEKTEVTPNTISADTVTVTENSAQNPSSTPVEQPVTNAGTEQPPVEQPTPAPTAEQPVSENPAPTPAPAQPQSATPYTQAKAVVGGGYQIPKENGSVMSVTLSADDEREFNAVNVNGKVLELIPSKHTIFKANSLNISSNNMTRIINKQENTIWGLAWDEGLENQYLITQGRKATKDMPVEGIYKYNGSAVQFSGANGKIDSGNPRKIEGAEFTADFNTNTFAGVIPQENVNEHIRLAGNITGNTFAGVEDGVKVEGGFFGPQANEMIGNYLRAGENPVLGVFGAKKEVR